MGRRAEARLPISFSHSLDLFFHTQNNFPMHKLLEPFVELIAPPLCLLCENPVKDKLICDDCEKEIDKNFAIKKNFCLKCGGIFEGNRCPRCRDTRFSFEFNRSVYIYDGKIKQIVEDFKYNKFKKLADFMAKKMQGLLAREYPQIHVLVPIPIHPTRRRERGFSQTELIARKLSSLTGIDCDCENLVRIKHTKSQASLTKEERRSNLKDAFKLIDPSKFRDQNVLLIDDVMTTGITMNEAAKMLKRYGAKVYTITFAIAFYRNL